jgi:hypothetical protein
MCELVKITATLENENVVVDELTVENRHVRI